MYGFKKFLVVCVPLVLAAGPQRTADPSLWVKLPAAVGFPLNAKKYDSSKLHLIKQFPVIGERLYTFSGSTKSKISFIPYKIEEISIGIKYDTINSILLKIQVKDVDNFKNWFLASFPGSAKITGSYIAFDFHEFSISADCVSRNDLNIVVIIKSKANIQPKPITTAADAFNRFESCIAALSSYDTGGDLISTGSGVVTGIGIITNYHVIKNAKSVEAKINENTYKITKILKHSSRDLALLDFDETMMYYMNTPTISNGPWNIGDKVYAIGCPKRLEKTISEGIISGIRDQDGGTLIQTTAPISPGSSGGGLFSSDGKLLGITSFSIVGGQNLNFVIPINKEITQFSSDFSEIQNEKKDTILYDSVELEIKMGNHERVINLLQEIIRQNPNEFKAWVYLGREYQKTKRGTASFSAYEQAFRIAPDNTQLLKTLVLVGVGSANKNTRMHYFNILKEREPNVAWEYRKQFSPFFDD